MYNAAKVNISRLVSSSVRHATLGSTAGSQNIQKHDTKLKKFEDIPGPKSYPFIGTLYKYLPLIGDYNAETLDKNAWLNWRRYGEIVRESPGVNLVHVYDPEDIEAVFRQDDRYPARRSHVAMLHYRLGKSEVYNTGGLLSTNGPDWWRLRSTFQKNFTSPQSVKGHIESTDKVVKDFVQWIRTSHVTEHEDFLTYLNRLNLEVRTGGVFTNPLFRVLKYDFGINLSGGVRFAASSMAAFMVIGKVAFNERFNSFSNEEQDVNSRSSKTISAAFGSNCGIMKLDKGVLWRFFKTPLYKKLAESQEYLEKVAKEIVLKKMHYFEHEVDILDKSLLGSFLRQPNIDLKDIVGMMVDILMAAIDTTAYATSFALYHLAMNPECQEQLYKEAATILPHKDSMLTDEALSKAHYARSCVKESLRLNPVSIGVGRLLQKDIVLKGFLLPKGTVIVTQNMIASRLPQNVRDPLRFTPDRWNRNSPEYGKIHPFLILPFGFGPRSCIARRLAEQNMCITLIRMTREYSFDWIGDELGIQTLLINKPDQPISLNFKTRSQ